MHVFYTLSARIARLDTVSNRWLVENSGHILRIVTGLVLLEFGLIKLFVGGGPLYWLATHTLAQLSGGVLSMPVGGYCIISLNGMAGVCFLNRRLIQLGVWLLVLQLVVATLPLFLFPGELVLSLLYAPTLVIQYALTDILLVMIGLFVAATWSEAQVAPDSTAVQV
ncbi:hypothetical protein [Fibrella arboris]|uniref:hypothetical protein n=1 Tax=Fibrella arboris TaxID=3242486 RepID=UPI003520326C